MASAQSLPPPSPTATTTSHPTGRPPPPRPSILRLTAFFLFPSFMDCMTRLPHEGLACRLTLRACITCPVATHRTLCFCPSLPLRPLSRTQIQVSSMCSIRPLERPLLKPISGTCQSATISRQHPAATAPIRYRAQQEWKLSPQRQMSCPLLAHPSPRWVQQSYRLTGRPQTRTLCQGQCRRRTQTTACLLGQEGTKL